MKVFILIAIFLLRSPKLKVTSQRNSGNCASFAGHSIGSRNFCSNCSDKQGVGTSIFWPGPNMFWLEGFDTAISASNFVEVNVTGIKVDNVPLFGWFHIIIKMPNQWPVYALYGQVEDRKENGNPTGEFTLDLMFDCPLPSENFPIPTESMILPCHATPNDNTMNPNGFAFYRDANLNGIIRSQKPDEFHINWRISPEYSCSFPREFLIRIYVITAEADHDPQVCINENAENGLLAANCEQAPKRIQTQYPIITYPFKRKFESYQPMPPIFSKVDCLVPISQAEFGATIKKWVNPDPPLTLNTTFTSDFFDILSKPVCGQGGDVDTTKLRTNISLFLGRCRTERENVTPTQGLLCTNPLVGFDTDFVNSLPTMSKYIEDVSHDVCQSICNVTETELTPGGGSLGHRFDNLVPKSSDDYPDPDNDIIRRLRSGSAPNQQLQFLIDAYAHAYRIVGQGKKQEFRQREFSSGRTHLLTENYLEPSIRQQKVWLSHFWHGTFTTLVFFFIVPVSIFNVRYLKESFLFRHTIGCDTWYALHIVGVGFIFFFLTLAQFIIIVGKFWLGFENLLHKFIHAEASLPHTISGWITIGLFLLCVLTGGLRPYTRNSNKLLRTAICLHSILGFLFYLMGLISILLSILIPHIPRVSRFASINFTTGFVSIGVFRLIIDFVFHISMMNHIKEFDKKLGFKRSFFPAVELVFEHRLPPGRNYRLRMFTAYIVINSILTAILIAVTSQSDARMEFNRTIHVNLSLQEIRKFRDNRH